MRSVLEGKAEAGYGIRYLADWPEAISVLARAFHEDGFADPDDHSIEAVADRLREGAQRASGRRWRSRATKCAARLRLSEHSIEARSAERFLYHGEEMVLYRTVDQAP